MHLTTEHCAQALLFSDCHQSGCSWEPNAKLVPTKDQSPAEAFMQHFHCVQCEGLSSRSCIQMVVMNGLVLLHTWGRSESRLSEHTQLPL